VWDQAPNQWPPFFPPSTHHPRSGCVGVRTIVVVVCCNGFSRSVVLWQCVATSLVVPSVSVVRWQCSVCPRVCVVRLSVWPLCDCVCRRYKWTEMWWLFVYISEQLLRFNPYHTNNHSATLLQNRRNANKVVLICNSRIGVGYSEGTARRSRSSSTISFI
jgi:hypothetical protein